MRYTVYVDEVNANDSGIFYSHWETEDTPYEGVKYVIGIWYKDSYENAFLMGDIEYKIGIL